MKNTVTAFIEFYFKGKKFTPAITIELDNHMHTNGCLPRFYDLIAAANNIDLYSYEYEMMLSEKIRFGRAEGLVADFILDGELDTKAFEAVWHEHKIRAELETIVKRNMLIDDLQQHPGLEAALREAYQLGKNTPSD